MIRQRAGRTPARHTNHRKPTGAQNRFNRQALSAGRPRKPVRSPRDFRRDASLPRKSVRLDAISRQVFWLPVRS